jgi:GTP-binding protein
MKKIEFIGSFVKTEQCPTKDIPEYAFMGRSNVGKSSLINMLTNHKGLARVSGQPGKTQEMNYFLIDDAWHLVDLPGYGFAKTGRERRETWRKMIHYYLQHREQLACIFLLIDVNVSPQANDIEMTQKLAEYQLPFTIIFTKADRLRPVTAQENMDKFLNAISENWNTLPNHVVTSAEKNIGRDGIISIILEANKLYMAPR